MSDDELAARLRERLERGELPRERLLVADALGHVPSRLALGRPPGAASQLDAEGAGAPSLEFWGRRLARFGPQVMLRSATALVRALAERCPGPSVPPALAAGIALCERFLQGRAGGVSRDEVQACAERAARAALGAAEPGPARRACLALLPLLRALLDILAGGAPDRALLDAHYLRVLEQCAAAEVPLGALQAGVRAELLGWALGSAAHSS